MTVGRFYEILEMVINQDFTWSRVLPCQNSLSFWDGLQSQTTAWIMHLHTSARTQSSVSAEHCPLTSMAMRKELQACGTRMVSLTLIFHKASVWSISLTPNPKTKGEGDAQSKAKQSLLQHLRNPAQYQFERWKWKKAEANPPNNCAPTKFIDRPFFFARAPCKAYLA